MRTAGYLPVTAFARMCGVSAKTLRFYGDIGLFLPAAIHARTRYRFYRAEQLREFAQIQAMRACGASLTEIRGALGRGATVAERRCLLRALQSKKLKEIELARQSLTWLDDVLTGLDSEHHVEVTIRYCPPIRIASTRSDVKSYDEMPRHEQRLLAIVSGQTQFGMRGVLWHRCADAGTAEGEAFVEVTSRTQARSSYEVKALPGVHVAAAFSSHDDEEAEATYVALSRWLRQHGHRLAGPRREVYRGSLLEIQYPIDVR